MRHLAIVTAILLALTLATPVQAGGGLPRLATFAFGEVKATVLGDSPTLRTGSNVVTLEISALPEEHSATLTLISPAGQAVPVALKPLTVLEGPADAHGGDEHGASEESTESHGSGDTHGSSTATTSDAHGGGHGDEADHAAAGYNMRGKVTLRETGTWTLVLELKDGHGTAERAQASVAVEQGGPSRIYLGFTGLLMGGTMIYGALERRRHTGGK